VWQPIVDRRSARAARTALNVANAARAALILGIAASLAWPHAARAQGGSPIPLDPFAGARSEPAPAPRPGAPRLVVALLYDQLRDDFLDTFAPAFGDDGFRRLEREGARFRDCTLPYAITLTGPGHASWLSGAPPSVHGIVANEWHEEGPCGTVWCARDDAYPPVGLAAGGYGGSPRNMRAETIADVLTEATRGQGKVIAIADKPRSAILPAGRRPAGVYWLDDASGRMHSSTYYLRALPAWVERANEARLAKVAAERGRAWTPLLPLDAYRNTIVEDPTNVFPHVVRRKDDPPALNAVLPEEHPIEGDLLFDFAEAAVSGEDLGADDVPDLLVVSVAITDEIGHRFGPASPEVLDVFARCDRRLGAFLRFLDDRVGEGRYVVSVTSDHGISPTERVTRMHLAAPFDSVGGVHVDSLRAWVGRTIVRAAGARGKAASDADVAAGFTHAFVNRGFVFEDSLLARIGLDRAQAARAVAAAAPENPWLADGFTAAELAAGGLRSEFARLYARSFYAGRSADVVLMLRPYTWVGRTYVTGTTHGTPYRYDRSVPFLLWGKGVRRGTYEAPVTSLDIAPTLASLLGIPAPAQSEGRALVEALSGRR
jgi:arylsulfatase A-like enzyme